ncbi:hypothetical protein D9E96_22120 [Escherichia coli]|nr:hypothetical protein [Escherichia coli]
MVWLIPSLVFSGQCLQDGQPLRNTDNQCHFLGLTCGNQTHIKCLYQRVKTGDHKLGIYQMTGHG